MKSKREFAWSSRAMTGRITKGLATLLMALALVFTFASCKTESEEETVYCTVTYSTEHATAPEKLTVTDGTALTAEQLPALTAEGYTFGGWYDGETKAEAGYKVTKDVTLTAKWTANSYTVTLNSNGSTNTITATYGKPLPDLEAIPTLEGSTFGGYYTEQYAKGTKFIDKDGKGSTAWNLTEDTVLYATWGYAITYKNTKDVENTNPEIYTGGETVTLVNLEKEGYTFTGWYDAETGGNKIESIAQGSTGAKTFYAQWTLITYTITYEGLNGAANPNTVTSYTVESETITLQNPTRTGYIFNGWFDAETGGNKVESIAKGSTEAKTLYAQWTAISYEITYVLPNGVTNPNVTSYTVETETITLQDFSHDDYTFEGWFDAETGGNKVTSIPKGSTGNKTLYAHCTWKWIGTKNPTTAKAVGDIVFSDGSATAYTSELTLTDEQKSKAVAVIFYVGTECSNDSASRTLGVGLKNTTDSGNTLEWAKSGVNGYSTKITAIQCTKSETAPTEGTAYCTYTYSNTTYYITGDLNGSDNWQALCEAVSDEETSGNYPAWEWVNAYATENSLAGSYANGWYLPTLAEFSMLYRAKATVNSALEKAGGTKIADTGYWSSSQADSFNDDAWYVWFDVGNLSNSGKYYDLSVCTVRAF